MDGGASLVGRGRQPVLPGLAEALKRPGPRGGGPPALPGVAAEPEVPAPEKSTRDYWLGQVYPALIDRSPEALRIAEAGLRACPGDRGLLVIAGLAALVAGQPDKAMGF